MALGRLDEVTVLLPNADLLLCSFVRKETVFSARSKARSRRSPISCCSKSMKNPAFRSTMHGR